MDAIMKLIKETLPNLSQETLENVKEKLVDIGVSDVDDMQLVQEQDLSDVLKPIQIRKITQLRIAAKSFQTHELSLNKDDSSGNLSDKSDSLFDSPSTSRCSTPSDTEITPSQKPRRESNTAKPTSVSKTANWVANFKIPWHKFPKAILEACENKVRPQPKYRREMVRILCEEIQQHCAFPGRKTLSKIAETVVEKYTESFQDELGGSVVGSGFESFRKQMEERLYNELRKDNKSVSLTMRLNTSRDDNSTPKGKTGKQPISDSYGCVNWQPDSFPQNESDGVKKRKKNG
ncbi:Hypothetical predicted protein [Paramuricea clavata]|uniref:Uncharacterized protein n=1 Tax=Paramuricea clavata TaxID=317549 RepID=A0A6S7FRA1_PARCT|nr:Hypothetical predicted protein [Paramuricea clavata]